MNRRRYLQALTAAGAVGTAGCLETFSETDDSQTILEPPEQDLSEASHPSYGDAVPETTLPDPLLGEEISTTQFEGERAMLLTFIYTNCPDGMCPALTLRLRRAQAAAAEDGYGDESAFLSMTFDPERDTPDVLETYADQQGVNLEAGNWHFLRPETYDDAKQIVTDQYGLPLEKLDAEEYSGLEYAFPHYNLILLVNKQGIVERAYPNGAVIDPEDVVDDFETVVNG
ncbi:SCO family protein [Natronorubrum sulfidifaciens]|uniref:Electron transport protein SCO1/SenC n=1 Tax=Natronorubrum sulfidifaciens JCM 14089 TaxID=1230460 RepID=L9W3K7_9EURY|nr:SCO family protein [Natronorubrum sulfidifaciens]ELY44059.1 electron transport protein SCO1/SenC [Natronorubrum sulfidifaciens JCM 14089]